jgi:hypothetical protein
MSEFLVLLLLTGIFKFFKLKDYQGSIIDMITVKTVVYNPAQGGCELWFEVWIIEM